MKRCRSLWAVLALLALASLVAPASAVDPKHLPSDSEIIFSVNFNQIMNSPLVKSQKDTEDKLKDAVKQSPAGEHALRYLKKAGFDPYRDLKTMTVAVPGNGDAKAGTIIVEANLDENKFFDAAEEAATDVGNDTLSIKKNGARRYLAFTPSDEKIQHYTAVRYLAVVSPGVVVASPTEDGLKSAWVRAAGGQGGLKKEIQDLRSSLEDKQSLTFVASGPALARMLRQAPGDNAKQIIPMIEKLDAVTASIAIGKNIDFQLAIGLPDVAAAKGLTQQAAFGLAIAKEAVKQKAMEDKRLEPAIDVMNSLRVTTEQTNVVLRGVITGEAIEAMIKSNLKD